MRGAPTVRRPAPALSLSLWWRMSVISRPLSESILGSGATRAFTEWACVSFRLTTIWHFFSFYPLICFNSCAWSFLRHLWFTFVLLRLVSWSNSNELIALVRGIQSIMAAFSPQLETIYVLNNRLYLIGPLACFYQLFVQTLNAWLPLQGESKRSVFTGERHCVWVTKRALCEKSSGVSLTPTCRTLAHQSWCRVYSWKKIWSLLQTHFKYLQLGVFHLLYSSLSLCDSLSLFLSSSCGSSCARAEQRRRHQQLWRHRER